MANIVLSFRLLWREKHRKVKYVRRLDNIQLLLNELYPHLAFSGGASTYRDGELGPLHFKYWWHHVGAYGPSTSQDSSPDPQAAMWRGQGKKARSLSLCTVLILALQQVPRKTWLASSAPPGCTRKGDMWQQTPALEKAAVQTRQQGFWPPSHTQGPGRSAGD